MSEKARPNTPIVLMAVPPKTPEDQKVTEKELHDKAIAMGAFDCIKTSGNVVKHSFGY